MNFESDSTSATPSTASAPSTLTEVLGLTRDLTRVKRQLNSLLSVVLVFATALAIGLGVEVWQLRAQAANSRLLLYNLQRLGSTVDEFRRLAARYPELATIAQKHGLELLPPNASGAGASPASVQPSRPAQAPGTSPAGPPPIRR